MMATYGRRRRKSNALKLGYLTLLTIKNPRTPTITSQRRLHGQSGTDHLMQWTSAAITPAPAGMGRPTKCLRSLEGFPVSTLNRASRAAPQIRNAKVTTQPVLRKYSTHWLPKISSTGRTPQAKARKAGATPKVMTSARESNSDRKSELELVRRAMR